MEALGVDILDVVRIGAGDEVDVARSDEIGVRAAVRVEDRHAPSAGRDIAHFRRLGMPMRLAHAVAGDGHRKHRNVAQDGPQRRPGGVGVAGRKVDLRRRRFDAVFIGIDVAGLRFDRGSAWQSERTLLPGSERSKSAKAASAEPVGVAENGIGHRAECRLHAEILRALVREGEDELRRPVTEACDAVHRTGRDEEHLAGADQEALPFGVIGGDGDDGLSHQAVAELVRIGMPVRFTQAVRLEQQAADRQAVQDRQIAGVDMGDRAPRPLEARSSTGEGGEMLGLNLIGHRRLLGRGRSPAGPADGAAPRRTAGA